MRLGSALHSKANFDPHAHPPCRELRRYRFPARRIHYTPVCLLPVTASLRRQRPRSPVNGVTWALPTTFTSSGTSHSREGGT